LPSIASSSKSLIELSTLLQTHRYFGLALSVANAAAASSATLQADRSLIVPASLKMEEPSLHTLTILQSNAVG
jgi:hypothetical protein